MHIEQPNHERFDSVAPPPLSDFRPNHGPNQVTAADQLEPGIIVERINADDGTRRKLAILAVGKRYVPGGVQPYLGDFPTQGREIVDDPGFMIVAEQWPTDGRIMPFSASLADSGVVPYQTDTGEAWNPTNYLRTVEPRAAIE